MTSPEIQRGNDPNGSSVALCHGIVDSSLVLLRYDTVYYVEMSTSIRSIDFLHCSSIHSEQYEASVTAQILR